MTRVGDDVVRIPHGLSQYTEILLILLGKGVTKYYSIRGILRDHTILRVGELDIGNVNSEKNGRRVAFLRLQSFDTLSQNLQQRYQTKDHSLSILTKVIR